jgi:hypothetical protein
MNAATDYNDPYPLPFGWPDDWWCDYPEWWASEEVSGPPCLCEQGFLPLPSGGAIECHVCGVREQ